MLPLLLALCLAAPVGKKYALVVGVNEYGHGSLANLQYADNDAEKLGEQLSRPEAGFAKVRVLTSKRGKANAKDRPTAANIQAAVDELLAGRKKGDVVLIALAGHGVQLIVDDPDGKGKRKTFPFFCPTDADLRGVSYSTGKSKRLVNLDHLLGELGKCGAGSRLLMIDACRSRIKGGPATRNLSVDNVTVPKGVAAMFSCGPSQVAYELDKLEHGAFFHFVLEGLRGKARDEEGNVDWEGLSSYVARQVPRALKKLDDKLEQSPHRFSYLAGAAPILMGRPANAPAKEIEGATEAAYRRGLELWRGKKGINWPAGIREWEKAARAKHPLAMGHLAVALTVGNGVKMDRKRAGELGLACAFAIKNLAAKGDTDAQVLLGTMYFVGLGLDDDHEEAFRWWRKAADKGNAAGEAMVGNAYRFGWGVDFDPKEAVKWYRKSAEQGSASGRENLAEMLSLGFGVKKDVKEGERLLRLAAEQGLMLAQYKLGLKLEKSAPREAAEWYRKALAQGETRAAERLKALGK